MDADRGVAAGAATAAVGSAPRTRIWDLPTRLAHWLLALLFTFSVITAKLGGTWIEWHMRSGYAILALLVFRILWGFAGSRYARFAAFVRGPRALLAYLAAGQPAGAGHNPLGALSVLAMLLALLAQASLGLFANDAIFSEGPLARFVAAETSETLTTWHRRGQWALYVLVGLHLAAIAYYQWRARMPLVAAMVSGDAPLAAAAAEDDALTRWRAALLLALAAALVGYVVAL